MLGPGIVQVAPQGLNDLLAVHERMPDAYPHLLTSTTASGGRYDILFAYPEPPHILPGDATAADAVGFWAHLDQVTRPNPPPREDPLPFHYGYFLYLGYELMATFEPRVALPRPVTLPLAWLQFCPGAVIYDRRQEATYITGRDTQLVATVARDLAAVAPAGSVRPIPVAGLIEDPESDFLAGVATIRDYIAAGDIFQANLSRRYRAALAPETSPAAVFRALSAANPAALSALATLGTTVLASASPERLLARRGGRVTTQPIAGTAGRLAEASADVRARTALQEDPKERAEHVMLVDLERNDLGRVCAAGSVRVRDFMRIETLATVHHLVSDVEGELRPGISTSDLIKAVFPGGSITGCPKIRCMQILAALEGAPREAYTGSIGYVNEWGALDLNILIRTLALRGGELEFRVGAGIVADSCPTRELQETRAKAAGMLRALAL